MTRRPRGNGLERERCDVLHDGQTFLLRCFRGPPVLFVIDKAERVWVLSRGAWLSRIEPEWDLDPRNASDYRIELEEKSIFITIQ